MIGEMIKEYLVGLGVKIDKPGFAEFDSTINKTTDTISKATSGWGKNFITASGIVATAIIGVTSAAAGLMTSVAKQDLAMNKYARSMMVSKGAAAEMKLAIDALGESVQDIQLNPELFSRYRSLIADGRNMKVGGDYSQTMKDFRSLIFEFTRLKQEAGYALQWVGYYLMKYLSKPLEDGKKKFQNINDSIIKTMSVWTEKVARTLFYIINIGRSFWSFIKAIGKSVYELWDVFPRGVKIATAALTGFYMLLKASPMGRMITLVSTLFLLIDDYFGHMEGRQAAFGEFWDKLNEGITTVKEKLGDFLPTWDELSEYIDQAWSSVKELGSVLLDLGQSIGSSAINILKEFFTACEKHGVVEKLTDLLSKWFDIAKDLLKTISEMISAMAKWIDELGQSEEIQEYIDALGEFYSVVVDLISEITDLVNNVLRAFFGELSKTGIVFSFKEAIREVVKIMSAIVRTISSLIKKFTALFKMMKDNKTFKAFWGGLGKMVGVFSDLLLGAIGRVGKLGQALLALVRGDFSIAKKLANDALFSKAEASGWKDGTIKDLSERELAAEPYIKEAAKKYNIDPNLLRGLVRQESAFNPNAESEAGAYGYAQLMPDTAEWLGVDINNPRENVMGGAKYLRWLLDYYDGDLVKAIAGYNAGPGNVDKHKGIPPFKETQAYVPAVLSYMKEYESRTTYQMPEVPDQKPKPEQQGLAIENPSSDMRDPTWLEKLIEKNKALWDDLIGDSKSAALSIDPAIINGFMGKQYNSIGNTTGGFTVVNHVNVGGVAVSGSNLNPGDVGNAVAAKTAASLEQRSQYVLQNRTLNGGATWT